MDRTACVDLPALPLQLLDRRHPEWAGHPIAVVDHDRPQGIILWVNERARASRIRTGMRYAVALSLCRELRAGVVARADIDASVREIVERLQRFTPEVEPSAKEPGVFWLGASGLAGLFPSLALWGDRIRAALADVGLHSGVAIGFTRFGSYAAARSGPDTIVFESPATEREHVRRVRLDRLGLDPELRDTLHRLGVETVGRFLELPESGVRRRFGARAASLHRAARGELWAPLEPAPLTEPLARTSYLDYPETDLDRLMHAVEPLVRSLADDLGRRDGAVAALSFRLALDDGTQRRDRLRPATSTLDVAQLLRLVRLRLESSRLTSGVIEIEIEAEGVPVAREQLRLFVDRSPRDLEAADRALARIRARFGDATVLRARLRDGHLPEAAFAWEPLDRLVPARPREVAVRPLVRRILDRPLALPPRPRLEPDGWLILGPGEGPVDEVIGPHVVSGGWWMRSVHRSYHYVRTRRGRWLWIYDDPARRGWFLHGEVA